MAARKYASDYRLEQHVSPDGKVESTPVYQGARFTFVQPAERICWLRKYLIISCAVVFALLLPMLFDNTRLGRTIYVILPAAFTMIPMYLLVAAIRRLGFSENPFTREHRDKTDKRIHGASIALTACLAMSCLGCVIHFIVNGVAANEILCVVSLFLALIVSIPLLRYRTLAQTREVEA